MSQPSAKEIAEKILDYFERGNDMAYEANAMMFGHQLAEAYLAQQKRIERLEEVARSAKQCTYNYRYNHEASEDALIPLDSWTKLCDALENLDKDAT